MDDERSAASTPLEKHMQALLARRRARSTLRNLTLPKPNHVDFSTNDFLSLSTSPFLKSSFLAELQSTLTPPPPASSRPTSTRSSPTSNPHSNPSSTPGLASGGSRLLDGNSNYATTLENSIATFHNAPCGLLFNSGFDANVGLFSCVPQPHDTIIYDELVHASVHDGMALSRAARKVPFRHNCVASLRRVLDELAGGEGNVFVAVEAIYSMDGDIAPLREIVELVESVVGRGRGYVVVDEAHATGVLGPRGRGLVCELGLEERVFARLHTFGKSLAANGAIILGSPTLRHYLINYARSLIYTTFLSHPSLALIKSSYALLQSGHTVPLQAHLQHLTQHLFSSLSALHTASPAVRTQITIPAACPKTPIFALQLENPRALASWLQERGLMARAVVPPTVPEGTQRVRICLHAGNTVGEAERLVRAVREWCDDMVEQGKESQGQGGSVVVRAQL